MLSSPLSLLHRRGESIELRYHGRRGRARTQYRAARRNAILAIYNSDFAVERKDDASPVTEADRRAEAQILEALRREITDAFPIVAEEKVAAGRIPEINGGPFWLVDPLDGTKEFVRRQGEFTVNIALIGRPPTAGRRSRAGQGRDLLGQRARRVRTDGGSDRPIACRQCRRG